MTRKEIEQGETIGVGFFINPANASAQCPGHLVRSANGRLHGVLLNRTVGKGPHPITVVGKQQNATWLFSTTTQQYVLIGVHAHSFSGSAVQADVLGTHWEQFTRQILNPDAVFQVAEHAPLGEDRSDRLPLPTAPRFDALSVSATKLGMWVGLEETDSYGYPPQHLARETHAEHQSSVGTLSVDHEGTSDFLGETLLHKDIVHVECNAPMTLPDIHDVACVVHDFINITVGSIVPASLSLYTKAGRTERHEWRRFDLLSQGRRFASGVRNEWDSMLNLRDVGGLSALAKIIEWCENDPVRKTVLARVANQERHRDDSFLENWRTMNMLFDRRPESERFAKLVEAVGKPEATSICPPDVKHGRWHEDIAYHRSQLVVHPTGTPQDDSRRLSEGVAFANHMEFLLRALILKDGIGVDLSNTEILDRLKYAVNEGGSTGWDWRAKLEHRPLY